MSARFRIYERNLSRYNTIFYLNYNAFRLRISEFVLSHKKVSPNLGEIGWLISQNVFKCLTDTQQTMPEAALRRTERIGNPNE